MTEQYLRQAAARAINGLKMLLGRGRVTLTNENPNGGTQFVQAQVSAKELMDIPRLAEFGFASRIPVDGDVAVVFLNAERTSGIIIASGHQTYRFKLENDGEMAIYDAFGKSIWLKKEDGIVIEANNQPITINHAKGVTVNTTDNVVFNMGGKDLTVAGAGTVTLDNPTSVVLGPGGKKVVVDGDPVTGGVVHATQSVVKA